MGDIKEKHIKMILNTQSRYLKRWMKLLCNTEEYFDLFVSSYLDVYDLEHSLFEFQSYLKATGRGKEITTMQVKQCIAQKDKSKLKVLLEELFLIPIDSCELERVLKIRWSIQLEDFIKEVGEYSGRKFARVIEEYFSFLDQAG
ncbi:MAG: hypothetical protein N3B21_17390 [Clostridia bacterium]|nr:hypothetical protein [Clostridia bacterium]